MTSASHADAKSGNPFDAAAGHAIEASIDAMLDQLDASSDEKTVETADRAIDTAAGSLTRLMTGRMVAQLTEAAAGVTRSVRELAALSARRSTLALQLAAIGRPSVVMGCLYAGAAVAAFGTELKLTDSLTDLLGYRQDDPVARAMGVAFASSLLVFEWVFLKLKLLSDPWPLLRAPKDAGEGDPDRAAKRWQRLRACAGTVLVMVLVAVAALQAVTIVKMAPMREIDGRQQRNPVAQLAPAEEQAVRESVLFFSICVLISGGMLAAAGVQELRGGWLRYSLQTDIAKLDATERETAARLDTVERPALAALLGSAGLPFMWLQHVSADTVSLELQTLDPLITRGDAGTTHTLATAAQAAAALFAADRRVALAKTRTRVPPATRGRSTRDLVEDIIWTAA